MNSILNVNGKPLKIEFAAEEHLLFTLRKAGFTEVKSGCKEGECGACIVLLNGKAVNSCLMFTASVCEEDKLLTVQGIGDLHEPHVIQQAFVDCGAGRLVILLASARPVGRALSLRVTDGARCQ